MNKKKSGELVSGNGHRIGNTEVLERPARRKFGKEAKLRILALTDSATPGEIGSILRREGIYSSYLHAWRQQRERGELNGYKPGRKVKHTAVMAPVF